MIGCLIIHGYTGGPHEVEPLVTYLQNKTNWHIVVPTLPGHGEKLSLEDVSHEKWIDAADTCLHQLKEKHDTVYLIGFSMGGMIAAYLAAKYEVDKLVLLAPAGKYISIKQMTLDIGEVLIDGLKGKLDENAIYTRYRDKLGSVPFKANLEFIKLVKDPRQYLENIEIPVFIAQGQQDSMVPAKTIYYLDKKIASKQKEVVLFERSSHLICLGDDKDTLNDMIYNFLVKTKVKQPHT